MIFADIITEALTLPPVGPVVVRSHVRKKPSNPKREAVNRALKAWVHSREAALIPTEGHDPAVSHG